MASRPEPIAAPTREGLLPFPGPCVIFDMPDEAYFAIHACSASGLKDLMVSAGDYWENSNLNPDREDEDSAFMRLGRAYHARVLLGRDAFTRLYAPELHASDFGDAEIVRTVKEIRAAIKQAGGEPKGTAKDGLSNQLLDLLPTAILWDREVEAHAKLHETRILLPRKDYDRIELSAAMLEASPEPRPFDGGHSEVAIFWIDEETGIPCKAKLDHLKMLGFSDLKTFSSKAHRPVQRAVDFEIANQKHYLPVAFYHRAVAAGKKVIKGAEAPQFFMRQWHEEVGAVPLDEKRREWVWQWAHQEECEAAYVYVRTTGAPIVIPRKMLRGSVYEIARVSMVELMRKWRFNAENFGAKRWIDVEEMRETRDDDLPLSASDFGQL